MNEVSAALPEALDACPELSEGALVPFLFGPAYRPRLPDGQAGLLSPRRVAYGDRAGFRESLNKRRHVYVYPKRAVQVFSYVIQQSRGVGYLDPFKDAMLSS